MKRRLRQTVAMTAALLLLTGCGTTSAQTTTQSVPESEAAKFGNKVVDMLNDGRTKDLFDLWVDSDKSSIQSWAASADAIVPEAKAKGIKWEYQSGSFGSKEGSITLNWTTADENSHIEYSTKKVDGKWRLTSKAFTTIDACDAVAGIMSIDGFDSPIVKGDGKLEPCSGTDDSVQILLVSPGEHKFSFRGFDGVFKQPFRAVIHPTSDYINVTCDDLNCKAGVDAALEENLLPSDLTPASGYADAVKKALIKEAADSASDSYIPKVVFNDDLTVTATDDPLNPTFGGTAQVSSISHGTYTINVDWLNIELTFDGFKGTSASFCDETAGRAQFCSISQQK